MLRRPWIMRLGEVLAAAASVAQRFSDRRRNVGRRAAEFKVVEDPVRQLQRHIELRPARHVADTRVRVSGELVPAAIPDL